MQSTFGKNIRVSIWGGSHEPAIGVDIEGIPVGTRIDMNQLRAFLQRRAPGNSPFATKRKEPDLPIPVAGIAALGRRNAARTGGRSRASGFRYRQSRFEQFHPGRRRSRRPCGGTGYYHDRASHLLRDPQHRYPLRGLQRTADSAKARSR